MRIEIGHVESIFRYPVKSMAGGRLLDTNLGWYGLEGDRRLAFRRMDERSGMLWLTAGKFPDLLRFTPQRCEGSAQDDLPTHIRTPDGEEMPLFGEDLAAEVGRRYGAPVQMMQLRHGIFDEASVSVIASDTVREIGRLVGRSLDLRRFRPNVVVRFLRPVPPQRRSQGRKPRVPAVPAHVLEERDLLPEGLRDHWLGHKGDSMDDLYDKVKHDAALRKKWAVKCGVGFELPA